MNRTHRGTPRRPRRGAHDSRGFSLVEVMVALAVTLIIMAVAGRMLAMSMNVRARENQRSEAVADVQRALQSITRDIGNAGLGLSSNGIASDDPNEETYGEIRIRSNLDALPPANDTATDDADEDIVYALINDATVTPPQRLITRQDVNAKKISQLANRIDALGFTFLKADGTAATPAGAERVRVTMTVTLPPVGTAGSPGYQPATRMRLQSEVLLRNSLL
jgi:prepilin-type N-terminal cleavage/methylation domain-containing protein